VLRTRPFLIVILGATALGAGACGGSSGTKTVTVTKTVTKPAKSKHGSGSSQGGTTVASGAENLVATPAVKAQLLAAGAELHKLPVSDYTGLTKGDTYYAYDAGTKTYWRRAR
jgi:hypothetical protein